MVKPSTKVRKKVKKNVAEGIAHVHASFNPPVVRMVLKVRVKARHLLRRLRLKQWASLPLNAVSKILKCASRDPAQAVNPQCVH
jgi:hypothetical protein